MMTGAGSAGFGVGIANAAGAADAMGAATCGFRALLCIANRSNSPTDFFGGIVGAGADVGIVGFATGGAGGVWLSRTTGCSTVVFDHPASDKLGFVGAVGAALIVIRGAVPVMAWISSMIFGPAEPSLPSVERGS